jgi:hypothetical protein
VRRDGHGIFEDLVAILGLGYTFIPVVMRVPDLVPWFRACLTGILVLLAMR